MAVRNAETSSCVPSQGIETERTAVLKTQIFEHGRLNGKIICSTMRRQDGSVGIVVRPRARHLKM
jgi:hypothetical protein